MRIVKAHAYGNDFLLVRESDVPADADRPAFARIVCDRHRGLGGDGLIVYREQPVRMGLTNADGSYSEISGNGVRCLAAWLATERELAPGASVEITTDAGVKALTLLRSGDAAFTFRAFMGQPEDIALVTIDVGGDQVQAVTLRVGNPQCVVLGEVTAARLHGLAARLAVHPHFPQGTNVELASVEEAGEVRILIWERGVGPTEASGTGACAAAVAASRFGGASRDVVVTSPGGTQRVEWTERGLYLTGEAAIVAVCDWLGRVPRYA